MFVHAFLSNLKHRHVGSEAKSLSLNSRPALWDAAQDRLRFRRDSVLSDGSRGALPLKPVSSSGLK
jgi:hypothetical protein